LKTLLELRIEQRRKALTDLYDDVEVLRRCDATAMHDLSTRVYAVEQSALRVARLSHLVDDLRDVETYGPTGGRGTPQVLPEEKKR
jgi:hypothetical protein